MFYGKNLQKFAITKLSIIFVTFDNLETGHNCVLVPINLVIFQCELRAVFCDYYGIYIWAKLLNCTCVNFQKYCCLLCKIKIKIHFYSKDLIHAILLKVTLLWSSFFLFNTWILLIFNILKSPKDNKTSFYYKSSIFHKEKKKKSVHIIVNSIWAQLNFGGPKLYWQILDSLKKVIW